LENIAGRWKINYEEGLERWKQPLNRKWDAVLPLTALIRNKEVSGGMNGRFWSGDINQRIKMRCQCFLVRAAETSPT
jgi:hypothetical protein